MYKNLENINSWTWKSVLWILFLIVAGCSPSPLKKNKTEKNRENNGELSENHSKIRASLINSPVHYNLKIDLSDTKKQFAGEVTVHFKMISSSVPLTLDFKKGVISSLKANGKEVPFEYNGFFITINQNNLVQGHNEISIRFKHDYGKTGVGLVRTKDPEDGRVYLYTEFEPYNANQLFPCFDQPDIKASYNLEVKAPKDWEVISAMMETSRQPLGEKMILWKFPKTPVFSTYVFPLHAGPFKKWVYKKKPSSVPLRLFARRSKAKYVKPHDWFSLTLRGLEFFNNFFEYPYPFEKYDQIIIITSRTGAMENIGAVTFSESFVKTRPKTQKEKDSLADVIYHEMAHMWFGNLVTMKWWNGLWLNESFASYMSHLAMGKMGFPNPWIDFNGGMKQWAYLTDQLVTTHPVESSVANTKVAFSNFDGISYGKGASVLKQLSFYIGPEKFQKGLKAYFKTHEFGNTSLMDFIKAMEKSYGNPLDFWKKTWLETSGINSVEPQWSCKNGRMTPLTLLQTKGKGSSVLRPHKMKIALLKKQGASLAVFKTRTVTYKKDSQEFQEFSGLPCPDLVFPNYGDHDFFKIKFDPTSFQTLMTGGPIKDPLIRQMATQSLWQMVQDGRLSLSQYTDLMIKLLSRENHPRLIQNFIKMFEFKNLSRPSLFFYLDGLKKKEEFLKKYLTLVWERAENAKPGSDEQLIWTKAYIQTAHFPSDMTKLHGLFNGKIQLPKLRWSQELRWNILQTMSSKNDSKVQKLIEKERIKDPSLKGKIQYIITQVMKPDFKTKMDWFEKTIQKDPPLSFAEISHVYQNLFPQGQNHLRKIFLKTFIHRLPDIIKGKTEYFLIRLARLTPASCDKNTDELLTRFLNQHSGKSHAVTRTLKELLQQNDKCMNSKK